MISQQEATAELLRMAGLDFFPRPDNPVTKGAFLELRLVMEKADTLEIARQVVTDLIHDGNGECPKPQDLRYAIRQEQDRLQPSDAEVRFSRWKEEAKREERIGSTQVAAGLLRLQGAFKRGRHPHLDAHMDLITARMEELAKDPSAAQWHREEVMVEGERQHNHFRYETKALADMRKATLKLEAEDGESRIQESHVRGVHPCECHDADGKPTYKPPKRVIVW